jgi:hypothetical protein
MMIGRTTDYQDPCILNNAAAPVAAGDTTPRLVAKAAKRRHAVGR